MKFCWCTISVSDLERSLKFYQDVAGLTLERRFTAGPGVEIAFLGGGETKVELICRGTKPEFGGDISLGFEVDSLDDMMESVESKSVKIHSGPFSPNPNTRFFYVQDPDGLLIQFVETKH